MNPRFHYTIGSSITGIIKSLVDQKTDMDTLTLSLKVDNKYSTFQIYHASLLYDILTRLLDVLSEKNIECVLVALRSVGGVLRKEEPLALKNFIHDTQARVAKLNEASADGYVEIAIIIKKHTS